MAERVGGGGGDDAKWPNNKRPRNNSSPAGIRAPGRLGRSREVRVGTGSFGRADHFAGKPNLLPGHRSNRIVIAPARHIKQPFPKSTEFFAQIVRRPRPARSVRRRLKLGPPPRTGKSGVATRYSQRVLREVPILPGPAARRELDCSRPAKARAPDARPGREERLVPPVPDQRSATDRP